MKAENTDNYHDSVAKILQCSSIPPSSREDLIFEGLLVYMRSIFGEYLTEDNVVHLAECLRYIRISNVITSIESLPLSPVTLDINLHSISVPRKIARKDELSLLLYSVTPYALLNRKESAQFAKKMFPNIFSTVSTIYSTFTKYYSSSGGLVNYVPQSFAVNILPDHSTSTIEKVCLELGLINQGKQN